MPIGRTASNVIKIKTDGGLRAVSCGCCVCIPEWSEWAPDVSVVCPGEPFEQYRTDSCTGEQETQSAVGDAQPNWSAWAPSPSTICQNIAFAQTRYDLNGCYPTQSQNAVGVAVCGDAVTGIEIVDHGVTDGSPYTIRYPGCGGQIKNTFSSYEKYDGSSGAIYVDVDYNCVGWTCKDPPCIAFILPGVFEIGMSVASVDGQIGVGVQDNYGRIEYSGIIGTVPTTRGTYTVEFDFPLSGSEWTGNFSGFVTYRTKHEIL